MTDQMVYDAATNQWHKRSEKPAPPPLTKCPKCEQLAVQYRQLAWGDQWKCTYPGCAYENYYSLGD